MPVVVVNPEPIPVIDPAAIAQLTALNATTASILVNTILIEKHTNQLKALQRLQTKTAFSLDQMRALRDTGMLLQCDPNGRLTYIPVQGYKIADDGTVTDDVVTLPDGTKVAGKGAGIDPGKFVSPRFRMPIDKLSLPTEVVYIEPRSATRMEQKTVEAMNKLTNVGLQYLTNGIGKPNGWQPFPSVSAGSMLSTGLGSFGFSRTPCASGSITPIAAGVYLRPLMGQSAGSAGFGELDGAFKFLIVDHWSAANCLKFDLLMENNYSSYQYDPRVGAMQQAQFTVLEPAFNPATLDNNLSGGLSAFINAIGDGNNPYVNFAAQLGLGALMSILNGGGISFEASDDIIQQVEDQVNQLSDIFNQSGQDDPQITQYPLIPKSVQTAIQAPPEQPVQAQMDPTGSVEADAAYALAAQVEQTRATAAQQQQQNEIQQNAKGKVVSAGPLTSEQEQWTNVRVAVERRLSQIEVQQKMTDNQIQFNAALAQQLTDMYAQIESIMKDVGARSPTQVGFNSDITHADPRHNPVYLSKEVLDPNSVGPATDNNNQHLIPDKAGALAGDAINAATGALGSAASGVAGALSDEVDYLPTTNDQFTGERAIPQLAQLEGQIEQFLYTVQKDNFQLKADQEKLNQRIHDELLRLDEVKVAMDKQVQDRIRSTFGSLATQGFATEADYSH